MFGGDCTCSLRSYRSYTEESDRVCVGIDKWEGAVWLNRSSIQGLFQPHGYQPIFLYIPEFCEVLPDECFRDNRRLHRVTFVAGSVLRRIGRKTFTGCVQLQEIELPATLEEIDHECFSGCSRLSHLRFMNGCVLKTIGNLAFKNCRELREIEFPRGIEELGCLLLDGSGVSRVTFASGKMKLREIKAFGNAPNLEEIEIPASVEELTDGCFKIDREGMNCEFPLLSSVIFAKESVLKRIGRNAFRQSESLHEIEIPASVEEIDDYCFYWSALSRITFGDGSVLKRIGREAFHGCTNLEEIVLPAGVEEIGVRAFEGCQLSRITFLGDSKFFTSGNLVIERDSMTAICWFGNVESIEIPRNVLAIGECCFYLCRLLKHVTFESGSSVKHIGTEAFAGCLNLESIIIPSSVEVIGARCFCHIEDIDKEDVSDFVACRSLKSVIFEPGSCLKRIEDQAFASSSLEEIVIPASVEYIGNKCFCCHNDPNPRDTDGGANVDEDFMMHCELAKITFEPGSRLKEIGEYAFLGTNLKEIEIPASVESLGKGLFGATWRGCDDWACCGGALERVTFERGSRLRVLDGVFQGCQFLNEIEIPASVEEIGKECFGPVVSKYEDVKIIPCGISRITFEEGSCLKKIGCAAFSYCDNLHELDLPRSVADIDPCCLSIGTDASLTQYISTREKDDSCDIVGRACNIDKLTISPDNDSYEVVGPFIKRSDSETLVTCFQNACDVEIPADTVEIGDGCFRWRSSLLSVTFTGYYIMKRIGDRSFQECTNLRKIDIPATVEEIGDNCFASCHRLSDVTFRHGSILKRIGMHAFTKCSCLKEIRIPARVEEMGEGCFRMCGIRNITFELGSNLKRIDKDAFAMCEQLRSIDIPASVEEIGERGFFGCMRMKYASFASNSRLKQIGTLAFGRCICLPEPVFPKGFDCPEEVWDGGHENTREALLHALELLYRQRYD